MPRVAFYIRISTDESKQKFSLGAQIDALDSYCKRKFGAAWVRNHIYKDMASGTHLSRPGLRQMLADAEAGLFTHLVFFAVDRLSRKSGELAIITDELRQWGIQYLSVREDVDNETMSGRLVFQIQGAVGEYEHAVIVDRIKRGMLKKAELGKWPGGTVPLGYRFEAERGLIIEETEAQIVRKVFEQYTQGNEGSSAIALQLNKSGYRTRKGNKFSRKAILDMLRSPFYVGRFRWQKEEFESDHKPIVSNTTFEAAEKILAKRSNESTGKRWQNHSERILSGLMRCSRCNSVMFGVSTKVRGKKIAYYACRKRLNTKDCDQDYVRADMIEEKILSDIQAIFQDEALLNEVWEAAQAKLAATRPNIDAEIEATQKQRQKSQSALQRYYTAFEAGTMEPATCNDRVAALTAQIRQLDETLIDLDREQEGLNLPALQTEFIQEILTNLHGVVEAVPPAQKKHLLQLLVEKVLIKDKCTFSVWYRLPQFPGGVRTLSLLVAPRLQYAKQYLSSPVRGSPQAIFRIPSALHQFKSPKARHPDFRVRLTAHQEFTGSARMALSG